MIEKLFIISFIVFGIFATMQDGMIFEKIGVWVEDTVGEYWGKPIALCPVCMFPWYGSIVYWVYPWQHVWYEWVALMIAGIGLNYIFIRLFSED